MRSLRLVIPMTRKLSYCSMPSSLVNSWFTMVSRTPASPGMVSLSGCEGIDFIKDDQMEVAESPLALKSFSASSKSSPDFCSDSPDQFIENLGSD